MTIVELRNRQNALAARFQAISEAIDPIFGLTATWTEPLASAAHDAWITCFAYREGYEHTNAPDYHSLVGAEHQIVHADFSFRCCPPHPKRTDRGTNEFCDRYLAPSQGAW